MATSVNELKQALATLTDDPDESINVIDQEIAQLLAEVDRLRRVRRTLAKAKPQKRRAQQPSGNSGKLNHWTEIESAVYTYVSQFDKTTAGDIAKQLGFSPIQVGKAVASSSRLAKEGSYVVLVDE